MILCTYNGFEEFKYFKQIIFEKKGNRTIVLEGISNIIETAYQTYLSDFNHVLISNTVISNKDEIEALEHCYDSPTETFNEVRGDIFNNQPNVLKTFCPYCMLNKPNTLDHYINKAEFAEFSILQKNLLPCCSICNTNKGKVWRDSNYKRLFIHFYNDSFIKFNFLKARIEVIDGEVQINYNIFRPSEIDIDSFEIIKNHYSKLELIDSYEELSNTELSTKIKSLSKSYNKGMSIETLKSSIEDHYDSLNEDYGTNYWQTAMYKSLHENLENILNNYIQS